ncbi:MAG: hypothetical protein KDE27_03500 [Planctomycetes bacterium]|nr:hypothetical protein [Planctomycetota bacterium]
MHRSFCFLFPVGLALLAAPLTAHGGQYRGPGNVVPPSPGGTGSSGPAANGPQSGSQNGPQTSGNPAASGRGSGAASSSAGSGGAAAPGAMRGAVLDDDLTRWEFWWEFGKDPFLQLRDAIHGGRAVAADDVLLNPRLAARSNQVTPPTDGDLLRVADRLVALLHQDPGRDALSAALVGLAKIGRNGPNWRLDDEIVPFLQRADQELRETAALALGIAGHADPETIELLAALVADDERGRRLSGGAAVNERTRAFAAFGLGLLLQRNREAGPARRIVAALLPVLAEEHPSRDLQVAAIEALAQLPLEWSGRAADVLRDAVLQALWQFYERPLGPGAQLVQAHIAPAVARLLTASQPAAKRWRDRFARDLEAQLDEGRAAKSNPHIAQSCAVALGNLTPPWQGGDLPDDHVAAAIGTLLLRTYREHKDHQARRFALISLARLGGARARTALLAEFDDARKALEQPWVAMALGVLVAADRDADAASELDREIAARLRRAFLDARNPSARAGLAIALGLVDDRGAADDIRALLREKSHQDDLAGYLCIALGMLRDDLATGEIRALLHGAARRPEVVLHCAQALGLLGDPELVGDLCAELQAQDGSLVRLAAAAAAIGQIGDRAALDPLLALLDADGVTPLARAFAVVGLGAVCDKDPLPWNATYATDCNYRASTSTLTDGAAGILDIL